MSDLLLRGGSAAGPNGMERADVRISGGVVIDVGPDLIRVGGEREIDCSQCWVGPGLVDLHTHLREPGGTHKEDIATGSQAAAAGGYTAVVAMPNTTPPIDNGDLARFVASRGREVGLVDVLPSGTLTAGRSGRSLPDFDEMWRAGVRLFTDDGDTVADAELLEAAMREIGRLGGVVTQHAIDPDLAGDGHIHHGERSEQLGVGGIPTAAETEIVKRDIALVRRTGAAYHLQHVSCAESVALVAEAKSEGLPITAEVTPHHLAFDDSVFETADSMFKMMPPLRTATDREALREGLRSGVIDVMATDHAPHSVAEKAASFEEAPFGVIGLADAAAVVNTVVGLTPRDFFDRLAVAPARIGRIADHGRWIEPGAPANIVVFDPEPAVASATTRSRSLNSPYLNRVWKGRVRLVTLRGEVTHEAAVGGAG